jgi:hypothetical protein
MCREERTVSALDFQQHTLAHVSPSFSVCLYSHLLHILNQRIAKLNGYGSIIRPTSLLLNLWNNISKMALQNMIHEDSYAFSICFLKESTPLIWNRKQSLQCVGVIAKLSAVAGKGWQMYPYNTRSAAPRQRSSYIHSYVTPS